MRRVDGNDLIVLVGLGGLFAGIWMISPAWALIVVGGVLVGIGVFGALRKSG